MDYTFIDVPGLHVSRILMTALLHAGNQMLNPNLVKRDGCIDQSKLFVLNFNLCHLWANAPTQAASIVGVHSEKCRPNVSILHLCKADHYHNSFEGMWWVGAGCPDPPMGGSINVLIRAQGGRIKVLWDDKGRSDEKPEMIVFPGSRLIAERDLTWMCRKTQKACNKAMWGHF